MNKFFHIQTLTRGPFPRMSILTARTEHQIYNIGVTIEPPWKNNAPNISCVPLGEYELINHISATKNRWCDGYVLALVNPALGIVLNKTPGYRDHIYIHSLNYPNETQGCIGPGLEFAPNRFGVQHSRDACEKVFNFFDNGFNRLVIE